MNAPPAVPVANRALPAPRVLLVIPGKETGPPSSMIFARRQAAALAAAGVEVEVFFLQSRTSPRVLIRELRRFRRALTRVQPRVIHAHFGTMTALFAALAAGKIPLVVTYRGSDLNPAPLSAGPRPALGRLLSQVAALRAKRIVCVSRGLRERLWWGKSRTIVLASGVDPEVFQPVPREQARRALGWPERERVVLFNAGHDSRNKRLDLAVEAARAARHKLPGLRLEVLRGDFGPEKVPLLMSAADCLLVTSDWEGSPAIVQEALATNLPIVSVAVGDVPERLAGVLHTRIVKRDPLALAQALVELVENPVRTDGRNRLGEIDSQGIARALGFLYREASGLEGPA